MRTTPEDNLTDVTVNLTGLWLLQAMLGIPTLAPDLHGVPYGAARTDDWIQTHPGVAVLREQGLVGRDGRVVDGLARRLDVLAAPDVDVAIHVGIGPLATAMPDLNDPSTWRSIPDGQLRVVLARREGQWVSAVRGGDEITIDDVEGGGASWLTARLLGLINALHACEPSKIHTVNIPLDEILTVAADRAQSDEEQPAVRNSALRALGVRAADLAELGEVLDAPAAEAVMYARAYRDTGVLYSGSTVNVRDTAAGRVVLYQMGGMLGSNQDWQVIAPATANVVERGVKVMLDSVGVRAWETYQRS
ncbi:ESX secretion-associated protein EspG [Mycobacterium sp. DSM 3803]|nr:ESX secretion-associated protein EspG [Mycobacterium sp. DSM 3803]